MANKHLKLEPHSIDERSWWYEEDHGITLVVENTDRDGNYLHTTQHKIRWASIRNALNRKDTPDSASK